MEIYWNCIGGINVLNETDLLKIQKKMSAINIILSIILIVYYMLFYWFNYKDLGINSLIFASIIILFLIEYITSKFDYFESDFMYKTLKLGEMIACAILAFHCGDFVINILLFGALYYIIAIQTLITYDVTEGYSKIVAVIFNTLPMMAIVAYEAILNHNTNFWVFLFIFFIVIFALCQLCFVEGFAYIVDDLYNKINSLNGIASTNQEENDNMKVAQAKLVQANELLSLQKFKLQKANEQITRNNMEMGLQNSITKNFSNSLDINEILSIIINAVVENLECDLCNAGIVYHNDNQEDMVFNYSKYTDKSRINSKIIENIESLKFINECYDNKAVIDISDYANIKFEELEGTNIKSLLVSPVYINENAYCIYTLGSCKKKFFDDNKTFLKNISNQITLSLSNALLYYKMKNMATKDALTGIFNRRYFNGNADKLKEMYIDKGREITVVLFDIDKFKNINDTYGHVFGDEVIAFCGRTANKYSKIYDGIAVRYGGEEFVIVFQDKNEEKVLEICNEMHNEIKEKSFDFNGNIVKINISVGIASYPKYCSSFEELVNASDSAMYMSKENGRGRITIYSGNKE